MQEMYLQQLKIDRSSRFQGHRILKEEVHVLLACHAAEHL
jgi:hypothetical protein